MIPLIQTINQLFNFFSTKHNSNFAIYYIKDVNDDTLARLRYFQESRHPLSHQQYTVIDIADILMLAAHEGYVILHQKIEHGLTYYMVRKSNNWKYVTDVPELWKYLKGNMHVKPYLQVVPEGAGVH